MFQRNGINDFINRYSVERIEDHTWDVQTAEFLFKVKWSGYLDRTWEPMAVVEDVKELDLYFDKLGFEPNPKSAKDRAWNGIKAESRRGGRLYARKVKSTSDKAKRTVSQRATRKRVRSSIDSDEVIGRHDDESDDENTFSLPTTASWESAINDIVCIMRSFEPGNREPILSGIVSWNGYARETEHPLSELRRRAPQKLLSHYEARL
jgi:hypothetical protein